MNKILVIDDDPTLTEMLQKKFSALGYDITTEQSGQDGLKTAYQKRPDLVILDIMMPELDGYEVCKRLREISNIPILMLTAKTTHQDVIRGFLVGADDYVKKPFSLKELEFRIEAILRRSKSFQENENNCFEDGYLKIDLNKKLIFRDGTLIHLTPTEYKLLAYMVKRRGQTLTRRELLVNVWGEGYESSYSCLTCYIHYLREKLEPEPQNPVYILSERGIGYRFCSP